jgi:GT2 family glycosyltransferase
MPASGHPVVSAIVVSHNVERLLVDTLRSIFNESPPPLEVIVVDNASSDGSADAVQCQFPRAQLIRLSKNLGFGRANNVAFERARGDLLLLLNPDVTVSTGCLAELVDFLRRHPEAGAVGPRIVRPNGNPDLAARRAFPTPEAALYRFTGLSRLFPRSARYNRYNLGAHDPDRPHEIDAGTAACLLVRREAIDAKGLFDTDFFMYGEDLDLCYRIKAAGWKIYYDPLGSAVHVKGTSTRQVPQRMLYEFHRAMWIYHRKHHADALPAPVNALAWAGIWLRWALLSARAAVSRDPRVSP